jgi:hypothetical protein
MSTSPQPPRRRRSWQATKVLLDNLMANQVQKEARLAELQKQLFDTELGQQVLALSNEVERLTAQLQALLQDVAGVQETPYGKVGYQPRTAYTYNPAAIREVLPQYMETLVVQAVDKNELKRVLAKGDRRWDVLNQHASTEAKTTLAWVCKPLTH